MGSEEPALWVKVGLVGREEGRERDGVEERNSFPKKNIIEGKFFETVFLVPQQLFPLSRSILFYKI
jgi:hypothetical protein